MNERLGVAGSGVIACGLAAAAAGHGPVVLWARSAESAERAGADVRAACAEAALAESVTIATGLEVLAECTFVIEAIAEDQDAKSELLGSLNDLLHDQALLATTTSSLSVEALAMASRRPDRFAGLHVFNPVTKMKLVELVFPFAAVDDTRERARALCESLGKTAIELPDVPGFVVNRLLFPYLFGAVELMESAGIEAESIDECMKLGAGHPLGPLALLDLVGLDVAAAIGDEIGVEVPERIRSLVADGALGRKSGRGFYGYE